MFSPQTRRYFEQATAFGQLPTATHEGLAGDPELGHFFQVQLELDSDGLIQALAFYCPRCLPAIACGAYLHEFLLHQPVSRADELSAQRVLLALGGLPVQRSFYAWLAVEAVRAALSLDRKCEEETHGPGASGASFGRQAASDRSDGLPD